MTDQVVTNSTPTWSSVTPIGNDSYDAALVFQGNNLLSAQHQAWASAYGYGQTCRDVLEAKFQNERSTKEAQFQLEQSIRQNAAQAERLERENQNEVKKEIKNEGERTRDLIREMDRRRDEREDNERRFAKLEASIAAVKVKAA